MQLKMGQPIEQAMNIEPFSNIAINILLAGAKEEEEHHKINIAAHVYFKKPPNMVSLVSSNTEHIYTSKAGGLYRLILSIGNFPKDKVTKSLVGINIDYGKVTIEDLEIKKIDNQNLGQNINLNALNIEIFYAKFYDLLRSNITKKSISQSIPKSISQSIPKPINQSTMRISN